MWFRYDDGGRLAAGLKGNGRDCVTRAIAIATKLPYLEVAAMINEAAKHERPRGGRTRSAARSGVKKQTIHRTLTGLGWAWTPTMGIGTGCRVHMRADELPMGRLIVSLSRHMAAVIDRTVYDTSNPCREGTRCVYGYYSRV